MKNEKPAVPYGADLKDDRLSSAIKKLVKLDLQRVRTSQKLKSYQSRTTIKRQSSVQKVFKNRSKKRDEQQILFQNTDFHVLIGTARIDLSPLVFGNSSVIAYEELSSLPVLVVSIVLIVD